MRIGWKRALSTLLVIAMMASLLLVPAIAEDELQTRWDLTKLTETYEGTSTGIGEWQGLKIDATAGKLKAHDSTWAQVNAGTIIKVPVKEPEAGQKVLVSLYAYSIGAFTVDEVPNETSNQEEQFVCAGTEGWVTIKCKTNSYLSYISVAYGAGELTPVLEIDKTSLSLKMGETTSGEITVTKINSDADVKAESEDTAVATAEVSGDKVTITAAGEGTTTVDISLEGVTETALTKKSVTVGVEPAGEVTYYIDEGLYDFVNTYKSVEAANAIKGLKIEDADNYSNGHGLFSENTRKMVFTVNIPEGKTASLVFVTCCYGVGSDLTIQSSSKSGEITKAATTETNNANSKTGLTVTVPGASGSATVTFEGNGQIYIHSMEVIFEAQKATDRKIDVWDLTGQLVEGNDYNNNITVENWPSSGLKSDGSFSANATWDVDADFSLTHNGNDKFYSGEASAQAIGAAKTGDYGTWTFADGYAPNGGIYCNGSGSATTRYMQVKNVFPGDKLVVYAGVAQTGPITFYIEGQGTAAGDNAEFGPLAVGEGLKMEFVARQAGTYKIYVSGQKAMYQRVMRYPGATVTGTVTPPSGYTGPADYSIKFVNTTTKDTTIAEVNNHRFETVLAPGYEYNAVMSGATGWGFTTATKKITVPANGGVGTNSVTASLSVEAKEVYTYSGKLEGFADGYDLSKLAIDLIPAEGSDADEVRLDIVTGAKTFSAVLDSGVEYTLVMSGVNDYNLVSPATVKDTADLTDQTITVKAKTTYTASGKFIDLEGNASEANVTSVSFSILGEDGTYTYTATVADGGYSVRLRDGDYEAKVNATGYSVIHHVVVRGADVEKNMLLVSTAEKPDVTKVSDVYVGYPDKANNYATINEAVDAISRMGISAEADRVTVHIAPGTYREQVIIKTPYITFVNEEPDKGDVLLTWYYGIGYVYYSSGGYYDAQRAYDKYEKKIADRWGTCVRVESGGKGFRAENIIFENSFNRYLTEEELADGVEIDEFKFVREKGVDVQSNAATERAAAICVEADNCEFYNCQFLSSQDTVYTQGLVYFKSCLIEGQTDYIFGEAVSRCIFDDCELRWKGYSENEKAGYITALRSTSGQPGYLFRDCTVTANPELTVAPGYWGRPWGADAAVTFLNTKLEKESLILSAGWYEMSGNQPENAQFNEYGTTTMAGTPVNTSGRVAGIGMTEEQANAIKVSDYYGTWVPYYLDAEAPAVDTGKLESAIAAAETAAAAVKTSADGSDVAKTAKWVTQDEMKAFTDAIAAAKAVVENPGNRAAVTVAINALAAACDTFEKAQKDGTMESGPDQPDTTGLESAIKAAEAAAATVKVSADGSDVAKTAKWVTQDEMKAFTDAIAAAKAALTSAATADDVTAAINALAAASDTFEKAQKDGTMESGPDKPDTTGLEEAITAAKTAAAAVKVSERNGSDVGRSEKWVTRDVMDAFEAAIAAAEEAVKTAATADDVTAAINALATATETFEAAQKNGTRSGGSGGSGGSGSSGGSGTSGSTTTTTDQNGTTTTTTTGKDGTKTETVTKADGTKTETVTKPDGTVTETVTEANGTKTETVKEPDGTTTETVTKTDGSKTEKVTEPNGTVTETKTKTDGAKTETVKKADGEVTVTATARDGEVVARVEIPAVVPTLNYKFEDVPTGHWAESAINTMAALSVVKGVSEENHLFDINSNITRGAMAQILFNLSNGKEGKVESFGDVAEGGVYTDAIAWAASAGVVNGYSDSAFGPDDSVTREQLAVMLYRYADLLGLDTAVSGTNLTSFADAGAVSSWSADAMTWAVSNGLIRGKGENNLDPAASASRAETAVILQRFLDLVK